MDAIRNETMFSIHLQKAKYYELLDKKQGDEHIIGIIHGLEIVETILLENSAAEKKEPPAIPQQPLTGSQGSTQIPACLCDCPAHHVCEIKEREGADCLAFWEHARRYFS